MFAIKVGNQYVVLDSDSTLSLEINNPLFESDLLPGDWTLPFTVPDHPTNNQLFNLPKAISNTARFEQNYNAELYIGGTLYSLGTINVTRAEQGRYSLIFGNEVSRLKAAIENKKLNEFDYGGVRTFGTTSDDIIAHAKTTVLANPLEYDYVFPSICNPYFYGPSQANNPYYLLFLNTYDAAGAAFKKNEIVTTESAANKYTLVPQPYLQYILKQLFAAAGFILKGDFISDEQMQKLIVYSNYSLDKKTAVTHHSKAILSTTFQDNSGVMIYDNDSTAGAEDPDDDYNPTTGEYTIPEAGYYSITPIIYITHIYPRGGTDKTEITVYLKKDGSTIESFYEFNYSNLALIVNHEFTGYFTASDVGKVITIEYVITVTPLFGGTNPLIVNILEDKSYIDFTILSKSELNKYSNDINVANHVPDMKASDFIIAIFETLLIKMKPIKGTNIIELNYAHNTVTASKVNNLTPIARANPTIEKEKPTGNTYNFDFPSSDADITNNFTPQTGKEQLADVSIYASIPAAKPNSYIRILNTNIIYAAFYNESTQLYEWVYASDNYYPLFKTDGETEVKPKLSPTVMRNVSMLGATTLCPQVQAEGTSLFFKNGYKPQSNLRLLFYHGMQPNASSNNYPLASATKYNFNGDAVGTINLQWDGDDGLYKNFHKSFFDFMQKARLVTHTIDFTTAHLANLDIFEKQKIEQMQYFISRIKINIKPTSIEPATVETYSIQ